jgi:hypothetical protein
MNDYDQVESWAELLKQRDLELQAIRRECGVYGQRGKDGKWPTALAAVKKLRAAHDRKDKAARWAAKKPKH